VTHPYIEYEGSALWQAIDSALSALEDNQDLALATARPHAVGFICRRLDEAQLIPAGTLSAGRTTRVSLANFLESVAAGRSDAGDWHSYVVTHYDDARMEAARREAVVIVNAIPVGAVLAPDAASRLRQIAANLREAAT
jgi:hypothetical protein